MSDTKKGAFAVVIPGSSSFDDDAKWCVYIRKERIFEFYGLMARQRAEKWAAPINAAYAERVEGLLKALRIVVDDCENAPWEASDMKHMAETRIHRVAKAALAEF